jgi:hypothetical protein
VKQIRLAPDYLVYSDDPCETLVCSAPVLVVCAFESDNQSERWSNTNLKPLTETRDKSLWRTDVWMADLLKLGPSNSDPASS